MMVLTGAAACRGISSSNNPDVNVVLWINALRYTPYTYQHLSMKASHQSYILATYLRPLLWLKQVLPSNCLLTLFCTHLKHSQLC